LMTLGVSERAWVRCRYQAYVFQSHELWQSDSLLNISELLAIINQVERAVLCELWSLDKQCLPRVLLLKCLRDHLRALIVIWLNAYTLHP
jgi:hypothetical protein